MRDVERFEQRTLPSRIEPASAPQPSVRILTSRFTPQGVRTQIRAGDWCLASRRDGIAPLSAC